MNQFTKYGIISVLFLSFLIFSSMYQPVKKKVVFFGDSITEQGAKPGGYIDLLNKKLVVANEADKYELLGAGIGGNKVYDLYLRMEDDVLAKNPDMVFIWVGVNDVWHKSTYGTGTDPDKFEKFYVAIIKKLQARNISIVLVTPSSIGEKYDNTNQQDSDLNAYAEIIRKLATAYHCGLCDLRKIVMDYEKENNTNNQRAGVLTVDGVHLNAKGNAMVADKFYTFLK